MSKKVKDTAAIRDLSGMVYRICPRCFQGRPYNHDCATPACVEQQKSATYWRDELAGRLRVAQALADVGAPGQDWATVVRLLEQELELELERAAHKSDDFF